MAEDRAEAMLVVGVLAAADVSRPTGRAADQGGGEAAGSMSGVVCTEKAGVLTAVGGRVETPLRGLSTGGARGTLTAAPNVAGGCRGGLSKGRDGARGLKVTGRARRDPRPGTRGLCKEGAGGPRGAEVGSEVRLTLADGRLWASTTRPF